MLIDRQKFDNNMDMFTNRGQVGEKTSDNSWRGPGDNSFLSNELILSKLFGKFEMGKSTLPILPMRSRASTSLKDPEAFSNLRFFKFSESLIRSLRMPGQC